MMVDYVLFFFAAVLSIPLWVISCELVISFFHKLAVVPERSINVSQVKFKILMPAHNEAEIIGKTLTGLLSQDVEADNIVVIVDNCTDSTATIAKDLGVKVLERKNTDQRGKGFALQFGIKYLKSHDSPDVLFIMDADCEIDKDSLLETVCRVMQSRKPIQITNLMRVVNQTSLKQRVAGFAWLVKNKIRPIAVHKLGVPVTLTGTGMAFPWQVISNIEVAHGNIVEDMQLGIDCTLSGAAPQFCEQAVVYSDFPEQSEAEKTQRTRWEHGHLMTIIQQVPLLIKRALINKDWRLLFLALDIGVPPLALLVLLIISGLVISGIIGLFSDSVGAFYFLLSSFLFFTISLVLTWWRFGRDYLTARELMSIPSYIISKLCVYSSFLFKRQTVWVRTPRNKNK